MRALQQPDLGQFSVGSRVVLAVNGASGTVRYSGATAFAAGHWVGVELDVALGRNSGTVQGVSYFKCPPDHGIFVRQESLRLEQSALVPLVQRQPSHLLASPYQQSRIDESSWCATTASVNTPKAGARSSSNALLPAALPAEEISSATGNVAEQALTEAIRAKDTNRIRELFSTADVDGVSQQRLQEARCLLDIQVQEMLCREADNIRALAAQVMESVAAAESRLAALVRAGAQLEQRVWDEMRGRVEVVVEASVEAAVTRALQTLQGSSVRSFQPSTPSAQASPKLQLPSGSQGNLDMGFAMSPSRRSTIHSETEAAGRRREAWASVYAHALNGSLDGLGRSEFFVAARRIRPGLTDPQISALFDGYYQQTELTTMDFDQFCSVAETLVKGDDKAALLAGMELSKFVALGRQSPTAAASQPSRLMKGQRSPTARQVAKPPPQTTVVDTPPEELNATYKISFEAATFGGDEMDEAAFRSAIRELYEWLTEKQAAALYTGVVAGRSDGLMEVGLFCTVAETLAQGEAEAAAELAGMELEAFRQLGFGSLQ
mmetsp:Transcript_6877/g.12137  ORF Transcript_6877/g.12137 Transcript_6877/m.12137 type:complete len:549 (-) Transcript_6877:47-1693(-)